MEGNVKKITRSKKDRIIGGVCGGLGEYFRVDSNLVRIVFIILAVWAGSGILIYLALWALLPPEGGKSVVERYMDGEIVNK